MKIRILALIGILFAVAMISPVFAQGKSGIEQQRLQEIQRRMVTISYRVPRAALREGSPATIEILGWIVDRNKVATMFFPDDANVTVARKPVSVLRSDEAHRLSLLSVETDASFGPILTSALSEDNVLGIDRYDGRTLFSMAKPPIPPLLGYVGFMRFTTAARISPGGGVFSRDGKLITIVVGWEEPPSEDWILVAQPTAFQSFIRSSR